MQRKMRAFAIKLAIGLAGVWLLVHYGSIDLAAIRSAIVTPWPFLLAFLCIVLTMPLSALRWHLLLVRLALPLSYRKVLDITFISQFFHNFLRSEEHTSELQSL